MQAPMSWQAQSPILLYIYQLANFKCQAWQCAHSQTIQQEINREITFKPLYTHTHTRRKMLILTALEPYQQPTCKVDVAFWKKGIKKQSRTQLMILRIKSIIWGKLAPGYTRVVGIPMRVVFLFGWIDKFATVKEMRHNLGRTNRETSNVS